MLSGGGGGFGHPFQRDAAKVAEDVREGYVSRQAAEQLYGVVLNDALELQAEPTAALRAQA
jgi:N-methylhydantoinase B